MGAIMDGNMVGCSDSGDGDHFTGLDFGMTMWVHMPDVTTEQYIYCDLKVHADSEISERFCISVNNGELYVTVNDATLTTDKFGVSGAAPTPVQLAGVTVGAGWNLIGVNMAWSGTATTGTGTVYSEQTGYSLGTATDITTASFLDSDEYISCLGATMSYNGGSYDGANGMSGILREMIMYSDVVPDADFLTMYDTGATCADALCEVCEGTYHGSGDDNTCFAAQDASLIVDYDFSTPTTYVGSITDNEGNGPAIADNFYHNHYL
jgi:hypothetical protein